MKRLSSILIYGLAAALLCGLTLPVFATGTQDRPGGGAALKDLDTSKPVEVIMYYTGDLKPGAQELYDNFNRLAKAKLNTTLKINLLPTGEYRTTYPLLFASGEVFDLAYAATWLNFAQLARRGSFMALEQLAPKYAPKIYSRQSPTAINQATVEGRLYALPSLFPTYSAYGPVYRTDLVKNLNWDGKMEGFADLERYLALIKANHPAIEPLQIYSGGSEIDDLYLYNNGIYPIKGSTGDFLFIDPKDPNPKLFTYWEWSKTPEFLQIVDRWNKAGYFPKSALADTDGQKMLNGKAAVYLHNVDTYDGYYRQRPNWEIRYANFATDLSNLAFTQDACVVASTSKNPDRALALYDLILSDEELYRAFYYGIEGVTYRIHDVGGQKQVESITPAVPDRYEFTRMWAARTKEFYLPSYGAPADLNALKRGFDAKIKDGVGAQKYRSFVIDTSSVETEYAACINVHMQYWWPLELAYTDISTGLKEYEEKMKAAGIDKVRAVLQKQLDDYIAGLK
ncbi:MAG: ABC transporter substrate-binding protein [Treponema sp.]|jgi:putative aldouronate transport system substrate-binding protein|nr:ABC transporter substrate-binding protein [Treponema sp.]